MDAPAKTSWPSIRYGGASDRWMRSATEIASSSVATPSTRSVNSSPPRRATVSPARRQALQAPGDLHEKLVAGAVAEAVVHHLEPVEIEEEHREVRRFTPLRPRERDLQAVLEEGAVGKPGERVVERRLEQPGLRLAPVGDVARRDQECAPALEDHLVDRELEIVRLAGSGAMPLHRGRPGALLGRGAGVEAEVGGVEGEELLARPPVVADRGLVHRQEGAALRRPRPTSAADCSRRGSGSAPRRRAAHRARAPAGSPRG